MVDELIHHPDTNFLQKDARSNMMLDNLISRSSSPVLTANVIVSSIVKSAKHSLEFYSVDFEKIFSGLSNTKYNPTNRQDVMAGIRVIHEKVRSLLSEHVSDLQDINDPKLNFWQQDMPEIDVRTLPEPSAEMMESIERMATLVKEMGSAIDTQFRGIKRDGLSDPYLRAVTKSIGEEAIK